MGRRRSKWKDKAATAAAPGTRLLQCAKSGDLEDLERLLATEWPSLATSSSSSSSSQPQPEPPTMTTAAATSDTDAEAIKARTEFLQLTQDHNESTALHLAASEGHEAMVARLLALGAGEIHLSGGRKKYARTPLHEAAITGRLGVCRLLVAYGFLVDCHTTRGRTPLMYAVKGGHLDVARFLIEDAGAHVDEQNEMGMTPLYIAAQDGHEAIAEFLIARGANVNLANRTAHAPLHEAVAGGHVGIATLLLDHGADKHVVDAMGVTIWHEAAGHGAVEMLELLVRYEVSLHPRGHESVDKVLARHPFHYAAVEGQAAFLEAMLARDLVDVGLVDADECSAIYYAAANGHIAALRVLLAAGGDPNRCSIRRSPLHCAVEWRRLDCIRLLVAHGADVGRRDKEGRTPIDIAMQRGDREVLTCFDQCQS